MSKTKLMQGDNIESLKKLPDNSIDSIVSDPPYGLSFMGKKWDYDVPSVEFWKEVYRVLKPGGHVLSFGGTRTYHRMTVNIEDAGFEIRDQIMWLYGSGFPKSHNIGKSVDKIQGNKREVVGKLENYQNKSSGGSNSHMMEEVKPRIDLDITKGQSQWEGWGTALKPANEPICVARKPLSEKSVAENVLKWGTGGINIDGCRVGSEVLTHNGCGKSNIGAIGGSFDKGTNGDMTFTSEGRFPANIILECLCDEVIKGEKGEVIEHNGTGGIWNEGTKEPVGRTYNDKGDIHTNPMCPCYLMDGQSGISKSSPDNRKEKNATGEMFGTGKITNHNDKGGSSRFFYQAKVSKAERNMGLDGFEEQDITDGSTRTNEETGRAFGANRKNKTNSHPTVKPVSLMAYLCRLVTPPNGIVLDPFMGSGSTGIAAQLEGFKFCGMEMDKSYFDIASARIENFEKYRKFLKK
jgi:site-specific DNA-methyltransferase (adenine-specific)